MGETEVGHGETLRGACRAYGGLEDWFWTVAGGVGVVGDHGLDLADEGLDLARRGAHEPGAVGQHRIDRFRSRPRRASAARRSARSLVAASCRARATATVLLDGLVGLLAADTAAHRRDQHLGGGQERQVAVELAPITG